jgi:Putative amidoligase enzyme
MKQYTALMDLDARLSDNIPIQREALMSPDSFGVEVEVEGKNLGNITNAVDQYWNIIDDHSLRKLKPGDEAHEYVFRFPLRFEKARDAITTLFEFLNQPSVKVYNSYRTSVHVHVNFGTETLRTIYNFITLSLILDELFVSQNGEHRVGNNFCLRAKDALGQVLMLTNSIKGGHQFFQLGGTAERYSSINFTSLTKFGSVEFRSLECTTHEGRLMHWIGTLDYLKQQAKTYTNPTEIIQQFSSRGPKEFLKTALGPFSHKYLSVPGYELMLMDGMRVAQDLAYCSTWSERRRNHG